MHAEVFKDTIPCFNNTFSGVGGQYNNNNTELKYAGPDYVQNYIP